MSEIKNTSEQTELEYLTDHFFDLMRHSGNIVYPYYMETEYAENIAKDYLEEHPAFKVPPMEDGIYVFDETLYDSLNDYCEKKCTEYGYDGSDFDDWEC